MVPSCIIIWRVWQRFISATLVTPFHILLLLLASKTTEKAAASLFWFHILVGSS
jgi:hypothetical protein